MILKTKDSQLSEQKSLNNNNYYFDKEVTNILKAILLIIMFVHHFFQFPDSYIKDISYPNLLFFKNYIGNFQICVCGFAFLNGYMYFHAKNKDYNYSLKRINSIVIPYWIVFFIFLIAGIITNTYIFDLNAIILEFFCLERIVMCFCWYVIFYVIMMLVFPLVAKVNNLFLFVIFSILLPIGVYQVVSRTNVPHIILEILEKFQVYFPIAVGGFLTAKYSTFFLFDKLINKAKGFRFLIYIALIIIVFTQPTWLYSFGNNSFIFNIIRKFIRIFSIPFFIYGIVNLVNPIKNLKLMKPFLYIGKASMLMWYTHCIFFNCSKEIFQPILFLPKNPILVTLWGVVICAAFSYLIMPITNRITSRVSRFLDSKKEKSCL